jgi:cell growth-regulating nucleolar protein
MSQKAFVEEVADEAFNYADYEIHDDSDDDRKTTDLPPEAPTPPSAVAEGPVNVFDFLVNATPNASTVSFGAAPSEAPRARRSGSAEETQLVRYDYESNVYLDPTGFMADDEELVQYGTGPIPASQFRTPGARDRKKARDGVVKKEKKRKRLHVDVPSPLTSVDDMVMTDAPPAGQNQTGLTAPISRMGMRPVFPPSPDYSGGDANDPPGSPLKKTKHSRHHHKSRAEGTTSITNNLMALITTGQRPKAGAEKEKTKTKKKSKSSSTTDVSKVKSKRRHQKLLEGDKPQKLLEYKPASGAAAATVAAGDSKPSDAGDGREKVAETSQLIVYRPRANLFLSYVNKGPDSSKGCSMNKVLKRYLREREEAEEGLVKSAEEKELWKSLRMRRNDRGEIVLFTA